MPCPRVRGRCRATSPARGVARPRHRSIEPRVARGDVVDDVVVARAAGEPRRGRVGEDRAADGEAAADRVRRGEREAARELVLARLQAEQEHAAAMRIVAGDAIRRCDPRRRRCPAAAASTSRGGRRRRRSRRARAPARRRRSPSRAAGSLRSAARGRWRCTPPAARCSRASCSRLQRRVVVGMEEDEALGDVLGRPGAQRQRDVVAALEGERPRSRQLDRPRDPARAAGQRRQHVLAVAVVDDDAEAGARAAAPRRPPAATSRLKRAIRSRAARRSRRRCADRRARAPRAAARWSKASTASSGQSRSRVVARCRCSRSASTRSARSARAVREEVLQLDPARHRRRAAVARDDERAAGVGVGAQRLERLVAQPAAQEAGHEGVAGAEDVEDLDRKAGADDAVLEHRRRSRRRRRRSPSAPAS